MAADGPGAAVLQSWRADRVAYVRAHGLLAGAGAVAACGVLFVMGNADWWVGLIAAPAAVGLRGWYLASEELALTWDLTNARLIDPAHNLTTPPTPEGPSPGPSRRLTLRSRAGPALGHAARRAVETGAAATKPINRNSETGCAWTFPPSALRSRLSGRELPALHFRGSMRGARNPRFRDAVR